LTQRGGIHWTGPAGKKNRGAKLVSSEEINTRRVWKSLTDAGLVEIKLDQFPDRIREVKHIAMGRLDELLELKTDDEERHYVAHSLGTLKRLETTLGAAHHPPEPQPTKPSGG
jgi:hypothetical protein